MKSEEDITCQSDKRPLISIIVPVYKVEKYLKKCVESLINQSYDNLDIILVDDGSPDKCGEICDEFAAKDKRIRVIHKENGGLSDARNTGLKVAKGNYIGFVDSDDYIESSMYKDLLTVALKNKINLVTCLALTEDEDIPKQPKKTNNVIIFNSDDALKDLFEKNIYFRHAAWNKLYNRKLFEGIEFPVGKLFEDAAIMYRIYESSGKVAFLDSELYHYVQRNGSITNNRYKPEVVLHRFQNSLSAFAYFGENIEFQKMVYVWLFNNVYDLWNLADNNNDKRTAQYVYKSYRKISNYKVFAHLSVKAKLKNIIFLLNPQIIKFIRKALRKDETRRNIS